MIKFFPPRRFSLQISILFLSNINYSLWGKGDCENILSIFLNFQLFHFFPPFTFHCFWVSRSTVSSFLTNTCCKLEVVVNLYYKFSSSFPLSTISCSYLSSFQSLLIFIRSLSARHLILFGRDKRGCIFLFTSAHPCTRFSLIYLLPVRIPRDFSFLLCFTIISVNMWGMMVQCLLICSYCLLFSVHYVSIVEVVG